MDEQAGLSERSLHARVGGRFGLLFYFFVLFFLGGLLIWLARPDLFWTWYAEHVAAPRLERKFAFKAQWVSHSHEDLAHKSLTITEVAPSSCLARAGVRAGDRVWEYHGRVVGALYGSLLALEEGEASSLQVVRSPGTPVRTIRIDPDCATSQ